MNISNMTRDELRKLASQYKIPGRGAMNKNQLQDAITMHLNYLSANAPVKKITESAKGITMQVKVKGISHPTTYNPLGNKNRKRKRLALRATRC